MQKPVVVVGSINLDLVAHAERIPHAGETVIGKTFQTFHGGKGANQAVAAARLGYPVCMVGNVGDDSFGVELRRGLSDAGADVDSVSSVPGASGVALITIDSHGENNIVVVPGANQQLTPEHLQKFSAVLARAGVILTQLEIPMETVEWLAHYAHEHSIPVILDPAPAPAAALSDDLLSKITWITPNESETRILLGLKSQNLDRGDWQIAATSLKSRGAQNVLLKLGAQGSVIAERNSALQHVPAFAVNPVDTTAAGDAFNGAFAVALMQGKSARESATYASAVAAISVTRAGAQPSMPVAKEVEDFMQERAALTR